MSELSIAFCLLHQHFKEFSHDFTGLHEGLFHLHVEGILGKRLDHLSVFCLNAFQHFHSIISHFIELSEDDGVTEVTEVIGS